MRYQGGSTVFLPPSAQRVWAESPIPASPALAPCTSHTAGNPHSHRQSQTERAGGGTGTRFEQGQCGLFWRLQLQQKQENVEPGKRDRSESHKHSTNRRASQCIPGTLSKGDWTLEDLTGRCNPESLLRLFCLQILSFSKGQASFL